jgi:hypothetical protein
MARLRTVPPSGPTGCHGCSAAIAANVHSAINKTGIVRISRRMKLKQPLPVMRMQ